MTERLECDVCVVGAGYAGLTAARRLVQAGQRPERFAAQPLPERVPDDLGAIFTAIARTYLPYLEANAAAYARGAKRVRYGVQGTTFEEPTKLYRVWCRDRLQRELAALGAEARAAVERAFGASDALERLATPSPRPAENVIAALPLVGRARSRAVDSWWRAP